MYVELNIEARWRNLCGRGKPMRVKYSERVPLYIPQLSLTRILYFLRRNTFCCLWPVWRHCIFLHYLTIGTIFGKKKVLNIKCDLIFFTALSEPFFILRRRQRDIIDVQGSSCKVTVILVRFKSNLKFLDISSCFAPCINDNLALYYPTNAQYIICRYN